MTITQIERLGTWIAANPETILLIAVLTTIFSIGYAQQVEKAAGLETMVDANSRTYQEFDHLYTENFATEDIVLLIEGEDVLTPDVLKAMDRLSRTMRETKNVASVSSIADVVMDAEERETGVRQVPDSQKAIDEILGNTNPEILKPVMIDETHTILTVRVPDRLSAEATEEVAADLNSAVAMADFPSGPSLIITGNPPLNISIKKSIGSSFIVLLVVAIGFMAFALFILFRHLTKPILPLTVVLLGTIWTFGAMGLLKIPLSFTAMAAFPVLIGLGINYTLQLRNRFLREAAEGKTSGQAIIQTTVHTAPAAAIAMFLTIGGFAALKFSTAPMIKDFGKLCVIGVIMCFLAALFVGLTMMGRLKSDKPAEKTERGKVVDVLERTLAKVANLSVKAWPVVLIVAISITSVGIYFDGQVSVLTDDKKFLSQDLPELVSFRHLTKITGGTDKINVILQADDITDPAVLKWMDDFEVYELETRKEILSATSIATLIKGNNNGKIPESREEVNAILDTIPQSAKDSYINGANMALINLAVGNALENFDQAGVDRLRKEIDKDIAWRDLPPGVSVIQTGSIVIKAPVLVAISEDRRLMTLIGLVAIYFILILIYRNPVTALLPILPMLVVIGAMGIVMYFGGIVYTPLSATFLGAMILGIGSGYSVFTMERFKEEKSRSGDSMEALRATYRNITVALGASGMTAIFGFSALISSPFPILSNFGVVIVLAVFFALIVTFTVFPVLLIGLEKSEIWMATKLAALKKPAFWSIGG